MQVRPHPPRPLLATDDDALLADLVRLAKRADTEVAIARSAPQALRAWREPPLVIVGADLLEPLLRLGPPHRPGVVVAAHASHDRRAHRPVPDLGAAAAHLLPRDEARVVEALATARVRRRPAAAAVSVVGGRGGAGASLLAVALALAGRRAGRHTVLLDADPLGCGLDLFLGQDHAAGARWGDLGGPGRMDWTELRRALPRTAGVSVLTWARGPTAPVPAATMRAALDCAIGGADLVVADLPRSLDGAASEVLRRSALALLVVPADVHAVVSADRIAPRLRATAADIRVVVRQADPALTADAVARALGLPLGADLPDEPGLARALEQGTAPAGCARSPLARFADSVLTRLPTRRGPA